MESEARKTSWRQIAPEEQFLIMRIIKIAVFDAQIFIENWNRKWVSMICTRIAQNTEKTCVFYKTDRPEHEKYACKMRPRALELCKYVSKI